MLKINWLIRASSIVALTLFIAGCKADLNDLSLERLSLVEVPPKTGSEMDFGRYVSPSGDLFRLRVGVTSSRDIWELVKDNHYLLKVDTFFCENPEKNVLIDTGPVYWKGQDVMSGSLDLDSPIEHEQPGKKTYSVYLSVYSPEVPSFRQSRKGEQVNEYEAYDLVKEAEDVCLTINGRTMVGGFKSNTVRIPKSLIRDELKKMVLAE